MSNIRNIPLDAINATSGTQSRAQLNQATVAEYAEALALGAEFPPVVVFSDGAAGGNWLADGFHRFHAHRGAGLAEIACDMRVGTQRDAVLFSVGANASHGLRRTNDDKRRAVMTLLGDPEWNMWSDNAIAKACGVSHPFVGDLRRTILKPLQDGPATATRTVERNGVTYEQNTANIGKVRPTVVEPDSTLAVEPGSTPVPPAPATLACAVPSPAVAEPAAAVVADDVELPDDQGDEDHLFAALVEENKQLEAQVAELQARLALLTQDNLAAQVNTLAQKCAQFDSLATTRFNDIAGLNETIDRQRRFIDDARRAAGLPKGDDLLAWIKAAARRAA